VKILPIIVTLLLVAISPLYADEGKETLFLRQGTAYLEAQDYQKAVQAFREAARLNPESADAQKGMGMAYLKIGYSEGATNVEVVENAVAALKEAVRIAPGSAEARFNLGLAYLILYDKGAAMKEYQALRDLDAGMAEQLDARIKDYKQPKSFGKVVTRVGSDSESTRVTMAGNHALVPVTLTHKDRTVEVTLVLDTGASSTLITSEVATKLNLKSQGAAPVRFQVADGRVVQAWHMKLDKVTVGPKSRTDLDVVIIGSGSAFPFDGLLGMDFLRSFKHSIDFSNQVINWAP
jgi:clan AA aspartic protease (TIGR02281 family)